MGINLNQFMKSADAGVVSDRMLLDRRCGKRVSDFAPVCTCGSRPDSESAGLLLIHFDHVVVLHLQLLRRVRVIDAASVEKESQRSHRHTLSGVRMSVSTAASRFRPAYATGLPLTTRSEYDFFSFAIEVVILTLKWISFASCPTTFSLMYSEFASPSALAFCSCMFHGQSGHPHETRPAFQELTLSDMVSNDARVL